MRRDSQTVLTSDNYDQPLGVRRFERELNDYAGINRDDTGVNRRYDPLNTRKLADGLSKTLLVGESFNNQEVLLQ